MRRDVRDLAAVRSAGHTAETATASEAGAADPSRRGLGYGRKLVYTTGTNSVFGLGDINQSFYFSPSKADGLIWGLGPSVNLPTATATPLGSAKFSLGPAAVALAMPKPWVIETLVRQLFSVARPSNHPNVSQLLLQLL